MKVIVISGKAQNGKDTTASMMKSALEAEGSRVLVTHYADLLKYICAKFFGWNGKKDEPGRHILQYVGTDVIRTQQPDFWVDFIVSVLRLFPQEWDYVIIPDCRFPNEIDRMQACGFDVTHIRVVRDNYESPLTPEQQEHPSETALDHVIPDHFIANGGTFADLQDTVADVLRQIQQSSRQCENGGPVPCSN